MAKIKITDMSEMTSPVGPNTFIWVRDVSVGDRKMSLTTIAQKTFRTASSQSAMLALTDVQLGTIVHRSDDNSVWTNIAAPSSSIANWREEGVELQIHSASHFSAVIAAAVASARRVRVKSGTYDLSAMASLAITGNLEISCDEGAILNGNSGTPVDFAQISAGVKYTLLGGSFNNWAFVTFLLGTNSTHERIRLENVKLSSCDGILSDTGVIQRVKRLIVRNCEGTTLRQYLVAARALEVNYARIAGNEIDGVTTSGALTALGIMIGRQSVSVAIGGSVHIRDNRLKNIDCETSGTGPAFGILVYGHEPVISGNFLDTVKADIDSAGIYVQGRNARITDNVVINAGSLNLGAITVKGDGIGSPLGEFVQIRGNHIEQKDFATKERVGIYTERPFVNIEGNNFVRLAGVAIRASNNNITMRGNFFFDLKPFATSATAQRCIFDEVNNLNISHNVFDTCTWDDADVQACVLIRNSGTSTVKNMVIHANEFKNIVGSTTIDYGVWFLAQSTGTLQQIVISDNIFQTLDYGVKTQGAAPLIDRITFQGNRGDSNGGVTLLCDNFSNATHDGTTDFVTNLNSVAPWLNHGVLQT